MGDDGNPANHLQELHSRQRRGQCFERIFEKLGPPFRFLIAAAARGSAGSRGRAHLRDRAGQFFRNPMCYRTEKVGMVTHQEIRAILREEFVLFAVDLEAKLEQKLEATLEQKLEAKLEQKLEAKLEQKLEAKFEQFEVRLEQKLETKFEEKLQPLWKAVNSTRQRLDRMDERLDRMERFIMDEHVKTRSAIGALKESIEARDFRLDDHGRRITQLEKDVSELVPSDPPHRR